jgi:hypothetical protein
LNNKAKNKNPKTKSNTSGAKVPKVKADWSNNKSKYEDDDAMIVPKHEKESVIPKMSYPEKTTLENDFVEVKSKRKSKPKTEENEFAQYKAQSSDSEKKHTDTEEQDFYQLMFSNNKDEAEYVPVDIPDSFNSIATSSSKV